GDSLDTVNVAATNWSIASSGLITTANDIAVNGGDVTSTGALTVNATSAALTLQTTTSGNVVLNSAGGTLELQDNTNVTGDLTVSNNLKLSVNSNFDTIVSPNPHKQDSMQFKTTHTGAGNEYTYWLINSTSYIVASGDYLEYDVFCEIGNITCTGGMEIEGIATGASTEVWTGRGLSLTDQNGNSNNSGTITTYANGQWYHRKVSLSSAVGKEVDEFSLVEENDTDGSRTYYYRQIMITNAGVPSLVVYDGGAPQTNTSNYTSGSSAQSVFGGYQQDIYADGAITAVGVNSGTGLLQGTGGLTVTGTTNINTAGTATTSIGNATGSLTLTGSSASTLVLNGITLDATELNRLDGKDATLVDVNDAVTTAIVGTGALNAGTITSGFGAIDNADTITGTTLNGTTGINTGSGAGTQRIDASGNLVNIANISATGIISGNNILPGNNASWEYGLNAENITPVSKNTTVTTVRISTVTAYDGTRSIEIVTDGTNTDGYVYPMGSGSAGNVAIKPGSKYAYSVYAKSSTGTTPSIQGYIRTSDGSFFATNTTTANDTTWTRIFGVFTAPATATTAAIRVDVDSASSTVYFDGFMLEEIPSSQTTASYWSPNGALPGLRIDYANNILLDGTLTVTGNATFNGDILLGASDQLDFTDEVGDKAYWYSNTYGTGIESSTLTNWSGSQFRWRTGGTSVSTGTERMLLTTTGLDIDGTLNSGTANAFQVSTAGAVTAVGVNSGTGLLQGTGGLTITGATSINNNVNNATNI
ncbi:carbohydrate binding domain-containing protein, partial [Candidatus Saccharibacteria bacterium]|nr:carbohydrate binding domain-containing protein [Candidatus Saccharibacteria bacterium]